MRHYTRRVTKHFYEATCPYCNGTMVYEDPVYTFGNKLLCEKCLKLFEDDEIEEVEAPDRLKVKYVKYQGT